MTLENTLLSLMEPGDLLRFRIERTGDGLAYLLEGDGSPGDAGAWGLRLGSALRLARGSGFRFAESTPQQRRRKGRGASEGFPEEGREWTLIRPRRQTFAPASPGRLGFGSDAASREAVSDAEIRLPRFASPLPPGLFAGVLGELANEAGFAAMEIDFEGIALAAEPGERFATLRERCLSVSLDGGGPDGVDLASGGGIALARRYFDLWLWHRIGWRIEMRAWCRGTIAETALELAGRCLFGAECELVRKGEGDAGEAGALAFERCLPASWPMPPLLPRPGHGPGGSASGIAPLHNASPPRVPRKGLPIGETEGTSVRLPEAARGAHTYIAGATGTGKSTLLLRLAAEDLRRGECVILIDPHGDLCRAAIDLVPPERRDQVLLVDPAAEEAPDFNVLDLPRGRLHRRLVDLLSDSLLGFFHDTWAGVDAFGPMFESYYSNALLLLALQENRRTSLADFPRVFSCDAFRGALLRECPEEAVRQFWTESALRAKGDLHLPNIAPYITSKVAPLMQGATLGRMLGAERDRIELGRRMNEGGIVLVNLDKGALGQRQSRLLGTLVATQAFAAGLQRAARPPSERPPVHLYIDEFQNFVSGNLAAMLSEARKFGIRLTLANQTLGQLEGGRHGGALLESVLGNVGNQIFFRLGVTDSKRLADFTAPMEPRRMQFLPNHHALARLIDEGQPLPPFVFRTLPPP